jgi:hypothetical protein
LTFIAACKPSLELLYIEQLFLPGKIPESLGWASYVGHLGCGTLVKRPGLLITGIVSEGLGIGTGKIRVTGIKILVQDPLWDMII